MKLHEFIAFWDEDSGQVSIPGIEGDAEYGTGEYVYSYQDDDKRLRSIRQGAAEVAENRKRIQDLEERLAHMDALEEVLASSKAMNESLQDRLEHELKRAAELEQQIRPDPAPANNEESAWRVIQLLESGFSLEQVKAMVNTRVLIV